MNSAEFIAAIEAAGDYRGQIVYRHETPPRAARHADPARPLSAPARRVLAARGIDRLYCHQAAAIDAVRAGQDVVVTTPAASGKSLCYLLPLIELLAADADACALLLFPTKALCQDQYRAFAAAIAAAGVEVVAGVFDGDTPADRRRQLRDHARVIFSNPDMVHAAMMPQHSRFARFLGELRLLVLDELHSYNGIFGSNMGQLLRRFYRVVKHYADRADEPDGDRPGGPGAGAAAGDPGAPFGPAERPCSRGRSRSRTSAIEPGAGGSFQPYPLSFIPSPQLIACSATIANPGELARRLTGRDCAVIDADGSPRGRRTWLLWNPPRVRPGHWRSRRSANVDAHELMAALIARGVPTITFSKARMTAEMILRYVRTRLRELGAGAAGRVAAYRGGYLPEERRDIERRLFAGELLGVSTTPALEVGIDVGGLDACIVVGYPGTLASFYQQTGRAGRREQDSLAILVGLDTAVNQYVMTHPDYLFGRPVERTVIEPENPFVILNHLRCAAQELPLPDPEAAAFGPASDVVLEVLAENRKLRRIDRTWYHAASEIPQHEVSLRDRTEANVTIEDAETGAILGEVDRFDACTLLHPGAIYIQHGDTWRSEQLDLERNVATIRRVEVDYYTQAQGGTDVHHIDHTLREKPFGSGRACWGEVTAYFHTHGFEKIHFYSLDAVSEQGLELPTFSLDTMAFWIVPPDALMEQLRRADLDPHSGLRGIGYATRMILPLFITCDTLDFSHSVGSVNSPWQATFIYERFPWGLGFTREAYERLHEILPAVRQAVRDCPCTEGCPCCVGKPLRQFTTWNVERHEGSIPSKAAALMILDGLLEGGPLAAPSTDALSDRPEGERERLKQALRRRLERMREPVVLHPIEPEVPTAYPKLVREDELAEADAGRRGGDKRSFQRRLRQLAAKRRLDDKLSPTTAKPKPPPGMRRPGSVRKPTEWEDKGEGIRDKVRPLRDPPVARPVPLEREHPREHDRSARPNDDPNVRADRRAAMERSAGPNDDRQPAAPAQPIRLGDDLARRALRQRRRRPPPDHND